MLPTYLREDVQELGDQLAASPGVLRDDVGVVEDAAFLKHRGLFQVLIRRDWNEGERGEGGGGGKRMVASLLLLRRTRH